MIIGFTGTRKGMSVGQKRKLESLLKQINPAAVHHGGCRGADNEFHWMVREMNIRTVIHWSNLPETHGDCREDDGYISIAPLPPLVRNREIVDAVDLLVAAPYGPEVVRSGTWATVRYARRQNKNVIILER